LFVVGVARPSHRVDRARVGAASRSLPPDSRAPSGRKHWKVSPVRSRIVLCYQCGQGYGVSSLLIHQRWVGRPVTSHRHADGRLCKHATYSIYNTCNMHHATYNTYNMRGHSLASHISANLNAHEPPSLSCAVPSAPGLGLPLPHLHRDRAHPATSAPGPGSPCHICTGLGLTCASPHAVSPTCHAARLVAC
jgi:hypothetical protein